MKTAIDRESPTKLRLVIEAEAADLDALYKDTLRRLAQQVKVPGFRKGKVPARVLETRLGREGIKQEVLRDAVPLLYARAIETEALRPVAHPDIDVTSFESEDSLSFTATVEVRPDVELPEYRGLELERPSTEVTDEEVGKHLDRLRERYSTIEPVTRNIAEGDYALIDLICYQNDTRVEEMSVKDFLYLVGSESFAAQDLDRELLGTRTGDILKLNATLDEEIGPPWGGEEVTFQVIVKDVQKRNLPDLDDEFARTASEFDTLEELKDDLRDRAGQIRKLEAEAQMRNQAIDKLLERVDVPVPDTLLKAEIEARLARLTRQIEQTGMKVEEYLESNDMSRDDLAAEVRKSSEKAIGSDIVLEAVARAEDIRVSPEELEGTAATIGLRTGKTPAQVLEELARTGRVQEVTGDILRRKALDFLVENAQITDVPTSLTLEVAR